MPEKPKLTVAEAIEKLKKLPQDAPLWAFGETWGPVTDFVFEDESDDSLDYYHRPAGVWVEAITSLI